MDREILFRAKQVCNNEWIEGYYLNCYYPGNSTDQTGYFIVEYPGKYHEIYLDTLCRYTGLVDKSGRKIWENDVVSGIAYSSVQVGYIVWIDEIAGFGIRYYNRHREPTAWKYSSILKALQMWDKPNEFQAEVIGNIFDNPDLIKD